MEKSVEAVYSQKIIHTFLEAYGLDSTYKLLGDFENYVYEVTHEKKAYILRITQSSHRLENEIYGELEWINYLNEKGANVPKVYPSRHNTLIEKQIASDGTNFYACLFSKVNGSSVKSRDERFNEDLFQSWGRQIGRMHRITDSYVPEQGTRKHWYEDDLFKIDQYISNEPMVVERTKKIMEELQQLPKTNYGLIHNDVHNGNFFYDDKEIFVFDFDDACYFWQVSDIAIPLYYACFSLFSDVPQHEKKTEFATRFLQSFMEGYCMETEPPKDWQAQLPLFLKVRDITLYSALNKKIAPQDRSEALTLQMQQLRNRIERNEAIVTI